MIQTNAFDYINVLDRAADAAWQRNEAISNNIANVDTPGYKRQDVAFESVLQQALGNNRYESMDDKVANVDLSRLRGRAYLDYAENVANANTTRTEDGTPYRRKIVTFQQKGQQQTFSQVLHNVSSSYTGSGVKVSQIFEDTTTEMNMVYDPSHPDADENGYVTYPNVNIVQEMTDLIDASRSYEANSTAFGASKSMALKGLEIGQ